MRIFFPGSSDVPAAVKECTDAEKKKFMQSFVDRIELYPERRKDGNWIKNILFNFSIPVVREDEELARIGGISCGQTSEYPK